MKNAEHPIEQLQQENEDLRLRLQELRETITAIQSGEVDAVVVDGPSGEQIFSLKSADHTYRVLVEEMHEGAMTLSEAGSILYANKFVENILDTPLEKVIGAGIHQFMDPSDFASFQALLGQSRQRNTSFELPLKTPGGSRVPTYLSISCMPLEGDPIFCLTITDLTDQKRNERILAEERLSRSIIEQSADAIIVCDDQGKVIRASRAAFDLVGRKCLNEHFDEAFHLKIHLDPETASGDRFAFEPFSINHVISGQRFHSREAFIEKKGVRSNHLLLSAAPLMDQTERVAGGIVNLADITEKIAFERRLKESQKWLDTTLRSIGDGVIATDENGLITFMNPIAEALTGWDSNEAVGKKLVDVFQIVNEIDRRPCENPVERVLATGQIIGLANHTLLITRDGREIPIKDSGAPIMVKDHQCIGVVLVFQDDTHKRAAEKALFESERFQATLLSNLPGMAYRCWNTPEWTMEFISAGCLPVTGYLPDDLIGDKTISYGRMIHPEDRQTVWEQVQNALKEEKHFEIEYRIITKEGKQKWVLERGIGVPDKSGELKNLEGFISDISRIKEAQQALYESELLKTNIIRSSQDCIKILDLEGRLRFMSEGGQSILEIDDITPFIGKIWADFWEGPDREAALAAIDTAKKGGTGTFLGMSPTTKGTPKWWDVIVTPMFGPTGVIEQLLAVSRDITDRKKLEAQLFQAQKMESIGTLAGGIAHDFNNLLSIISGNNELLLELIEWNDPKQEYAEEIKQAAQRATALTRQLLAFSRKQIVEPKIVDINRILADLEKMVVRLIGEDILLETLPSSEILSVKIDPGQLEQVIINLAVNARDAMPKGGKLTIETANIDLDEAYFDKRGVLSAPGPYAVIAISDTGMGMDEKTLAQIFDPFFSTKERGRGTGLGLSTTYGIVKQNHGLIWVYSEPGRGATFKVYLPRTDETAISKKTMKIPEDLSKGSETILVVEDDDSLRKLARKLLERQGYKVLEAKDGREALDIFREHKDSICLLLTDVIMPGMSGKDIAEQISAIKPELKVIFMSGYTDNIIVRHGVLDPNIDFIEKPFSANLVEKVRNVLDSTGRKCQE